MTTPSGPTEADLWAWSEEDAAPRQLESRGRGRRFRLLVALAVILGLSCVFALVKGAMAAWAGWEGRSALVSAEGSLRAQKVEEARSYLREGERAFGRMRSHLAQTGPAGAVVRHLPLLRAQVWAVEAFAEAGQTVSRAALPLTDAADRLLSPDLQGVSLSTARGPLEEIRGAVREARPGFEAAFSRVAELDEVRVLWPISAVRSDLRGRLEDARDQAEAADEGIGALLTFMGGAGPRRYLLFSQNPDEVRPTGGFIGTYGVLAADREGLRLERFEGIERWRQAHPDVTIPQDQVGPPFRFGQLGATSIQNVNMTPDWPTASRLAMQLWERGGEAPVQGVIAVTPAFLVRMLEVTGPVPVPEYGETVDVNNVVERMDFYAHEAGLGGDRKDFIGAVAQAVLARVVNAPASNWVLLGRLLGESFEERDAVAWSTDADVAQVLDDREWDGAFPETGGDFFYNAEFSFARKNGRGIRRTFDHKVTIKSDGSARIETNLTLRNTEPLDDFNLNTLAYVTVYGPRGAQLDPASHRPAAIEPNLAGHPAAGWFLAAPPEGGTRLKVVWEAPNIVRRLPDGRDVYALWWMALPDHTGDVLNLTVELPDGWGWAGDSPPDRVELDRDFIATWEIEK